MLRKLNALVYKEWKDKFCEPPKYSKLEYFLIFSRLFVIKKKLKQNI